MSGWRRWWVHKYSFGVLRCSVFCVHPNTPYLGSTCVLLLHERVWRSWIGIFCLTFQNLDLNLDTWTACGLRFLLAPLIAFGLAFNFSIGWTREKYRNFASSYADSNSCCHYSNWIRSRSWFRHNLCTTLNNTWCVYTDNSIVNHLSRSKNISVSF